MSLVISLAAVIILALVAWAGAAAGLGTLFGVVIPYLALAVFILGIIYRVYKWARSPVPFRIPTTTGQQRSLSWFKQSKLENPDTLTGVIGRMLLEILLFRSLFRNTRSEVKDGRIFYGSSKWLWVAAMAFHWTFLVIFLRHFRFFVEPAPFFVPWLQYLDAFFEIGVPALFITDAIIILALGYLLVRRLFIPQMRYISLASDYFPLFLILAIAITGVLMRHFFKVDLVAVKELATGIFALSPTVPEGIGAMFYVHLFLVSSLLIYFPFSKLLHMPGVFLSPTRNLANTSRVKRHINPWNYPVEVHTYEEWEDEFRDLMKECGLPLEKEQ